MCFLTLSSQVSGYYHGRDLIRNHVHTLQFFLVSEYFAEEPSIGLVKPNIKTMFLPAHSLSWERGVHEVANSPIKVHGRTTDRWHFNSMEYKSSKNLVKYAFWLKWLKSEFCSIISCNHKIIYLLESWLNLYGVIIHILQGTNTRYVKRFCNLYRKHKMITEKTVEEITTPARESRQCGEEWREDDEHLFTRLYVRITANCHGVRAVVQW